MALKCDEAVALESEAPEADHLPAQANMVLSAMDAARAPTMERRSISRVKFRVEGSLRLFSDERADALGASLHAI